jgi:hypothetical protein
MYPYYMARCYNSNQRAADVAYLEKLKEQLEALQTSYLQATTDTVESYRFDDGAGSQQRKNRDTTKMMGDMDALKRLIDWYERKLGGCLNVDIVQRRRLYRRTRFTP